MARRASPFMIGLFVTIGVTIGVSIIVWIGASQYFEKGTMYVTYFDESVQGLQKDSSVKYRGVEVGRIVKIGVAPDNKLIEVVMKINLKNDLERNTMTQLKAVGITGIVFVELDQQLPGAMKLSPQISFAAEYPVIPSRPSETKQLLSDIYNVIDKINDVDFRGISDKIKSTAQSADDFLAGAQTKRIMSNLESSTTALDKSMKGLEKVIADGNLGETITEARQALAEARSLLTKLNSDVKDMRLKDTAVKANQVMDALDRTARTSAVDIQTATENLRRASESLERLLERIEANPSDLLFSRPAEPRQ
ncbi:MAG: MlaD family protein [Syntrophales bacterium]|jgi:phospholipid/cholesterol/gamma-HCH transport system substrate-binding protein